MPDFTSTTRLKVLLGIPAAVTQHDAKLTNVAAAVDQQMLDLMGMAAFTSGTWTETLDVDGPNVEMLALKYSPVTSVAAVTDNGQSVQSTAYYANSAGFLIRKDGGYFTPGWQRVSITYTAGQAIPGSLLLAGDELGAAMFNAAPHAGFDSERLGDYNYRLPESSIPATVLRALAGYRRVHGRR